ncbi:MAG TPA: NAD(P)-binding domain-containing protein [Candidatus Dormibacteraeota bacterium]|nr:NAD(P)-binding domain-containing protein [Candidatus Dormibacteraeota bacterium]
MNPDARVLLLGDPVSRSLSPGMQNAAFEALGIDCRYLLREVNRAGLAGAMAELRGDERILGANVTIPHKESVIPYLDDLDAQADRIGAVNTISRQGAKLKGWNSDIEGFQRALAEMGGSYSRVAIIGAGGAARAVAAALQPAAEVWVVARNVEQARRLCHDLEIVRGGPVKMDQLQEAVAKAQLVVNATPAELPPASWLRTDQVLFDLRSRRSAEGRAMLLHQGAASFEIWTGRKAPIDVMRAALDRASVPA